MTNSLVTYFDYKSPYAYVAKNLIYDLANEFSLEIDWRPYSITIDNAFGTAEVNEKAEVIADGRSAHQWRRVKYMYMDCRRIAKRRGLELHAPRRVFQSVVAHIGTLYAQRHGAFRSYHDAVFDRFWRRDLDIDDVGEIAQVLSDAGVDADGFKEFVDGEGRSEHDRLMEEAHAMGIFGVPSFVIGGELFWGGEHIPYIREMLAAECARSA